MKDPVFEILEQMLRHSPKRSYQRLNPALRSTLENCIKGDLPFQTSTFARIFYELRGGWWFGDGAGSNVGEHFYTMACSCNHASAQQSFEHFAERPGVLWEENASMPFRLHVGAAFTWQGHYVRVTSMRKDKLVACSYTRSRSVDGLRVGATIGYNPEHLITSAKREHGSTLLRVVKVDNSYDGEKVSRRFTITYDEIKEFRRTAKARVRVMLDKIESCDPTKDSARLTKDVNSEHFRHFELEEIQAAFQKRRDWIVKEESTEAWRKGKGGAWLDVKFVALRVNGDRVECSNGNSVSKAAAVRVLPVLLEQRVKPATLALPIDSYCINRVSSSSVKIGCTIIPWKEIDRIIPELKSART